MEGQQNLKTDYQDYTYVGNKKFNLINNSDGTISLEDVTDYEIEGDDFGASDINATNQRINEMNDNVKMSKYQPGDKFKASTYLDCPGLITTSTTMVRFDVHTDKSLADINSISCESLKVELRGVSGYLNDKSGYNEYTNNSDYSVSCVKEINNVFSVRIIKNSAWTNTVNNTPVIATLNDDTEFIFA